MNQENNNFKPVVDSYYFGLYLNDQIIAKSIFDADVYNQSVRYSVNIKDKAGEFLRNFQKILSLPDKSLDFELYDYDFLNFYKEQDEENQEKLENSRNGRTENNRYVNDDEKFKFVLHINNNLVIERNFYVKNYNPNTRFSLQLLDYINEVIFDIKEYLKKRDISTIWEELDIKSTYNMTSDKVRSLSKEEKDSLIKKMNIN